MQRYCEPNTVENQSKHKQGNVAVEAKITYNNVFVLIHKYFSSYFPL